MSRDTGPDEQGLQQVRMRRVVLVMQMLAALDRAAALAEHGGGDRIVIVQIAIGHVAAEQQNRIVQHRLLK